MLRILTKPPVLLLIAIIIAACSVFFWYRSEEIGNGVGSGAGKMTGLAVGSYKGVTEGLEKGAQAGKEAGLKSDDMTAEISGTVKEVRFRIVIRRNGNYDKIRVGICRFCIGNSAKRKIAFGMLRQVFFDVFVAYRALPCVYFFNFFGNDIYRRDVVMLRKKNGERKADVSGSCNCNFHI